MVWADTPIPLIRETGIASRPDIPESHACVHYARMMSLIHNVVIRAFNSAYNQASAVEPGTQNAEDFLVYNQCIYETIHHHHDTEEEIFFPGIAKIAGRDDFMDENVKQHRAFEQGLEDYRTYVFAATKDTYDSEKFRALMDSFVEPLGKHLHEEIPSFFSLKDLKSTELMKLWAEADKYAQKGGELRRYAN